MNSAIEEEGEEGWTRWCVPLTLIMFPPIPPVCKYNFFKCLAVTVVDTHAYIIKYSLICKFICPFRRTKHLHPLRGRTITRIKSIRVRLDSRTRQEDGGGVFLGRVEGESGGLTAALKRDSGETRVEVFSY